MSTETSSASPNPMPCGNKKRTRASFTTEENLLLRMLVQIHGTNSWNTVASKMIGRTARQCKERWFSYLSPSITNAPWTPYEDERLKWLANVYNKKWVIIARFFPGRSDSQVKNRWYTRVDHRRPKEEQEPQAQPALEAISVDIDDEFIFDENCDAFMDIQV